MKTPPNRSILRSKSFTQPRSRGLLLRISGIFVCCSLLVLLWAGVANWHTSLKVPSSENGPDAAAADAMERGELAHSLKKFEMYRTAVAQEFGLPTEDHPRRDASQSGALAAAVEDRKGVGMEVESRELWGDSPAGAKAADSSSLQECWSKRIPRQEVRTAGFVLLSCRGGAEQQRMQVSDAVAVAYHLGAALVVPTIKEANSQPVSTFPELYAVNHFVRSLSKLVEVVTTLPPEYSNKEPVHVTVPREVTAVYIDKHIRPTYLEAQVISIGPFEPPLNQSRAPDDPLQAIRCLVNYQALRFGPELLRFGKRLVERMREAGKAAGGRFLAVDLVVGKRTRKKCRRARWQSMTGEDPQQARLALARQKRRDKVCPMGPRDVMKLLRALGYSSETAIYLTAQGWHPSLAPLLQFYPNLLTKEYFTPQFEEDQLVHSKPVLHMLLDFYVCIESDVFVAATPGPFEKAVVGQRIFSNFGKVLRPSSLSLLNRTGLQWDHEAALIRQMHSYNQMEPLEGSLGIATVYNHPQHFCVCQESGNETMAEAGKGGSGMARGRVQQQPSSPTRERGQAEEDESHEGHRRQGGKVEPGKEIEEGRKSEKGMEREVSVTGSQETQEGRGSSREGGEGRSEGGRGVLPVETDGKGEAGKSVEAEVPSDRDEVSPVDGQTDTASRAEEDRIEGDENESRNTRDTASEGGLRKEGEEKVEYRGFTKSAEEVSVKEGSIEEHPTSSNSTVVMGEGSAKAQEKSFEEAKENADPGSEEQGHGLHGGFVPANETGHNDINDSAASKNSELGETTSGTDGSSFTKGAVTAERGNAQKEGTKRRRLVGIPTDIEEAQSRSGSGSGLSHHFHSPLHNRRRTRSEHDFDPD